MTFMENILAHNIPIWEQCAATPFVREMQNGMLPFEKFNNSILGLFDALCSTDEVHRGKEYPDIFEYAAQKLSVAPERCIVFDDVLPAIRSAKQAKMLAGGVYDKYSADQRREIEKIADIYLLDFKLAPIPRKGV